MSEVSMRYHINNDDTERPVPSEADIHPSAYIGENAAFGRHAKVGRDCVIEDGAIVGDHVMIEDGKSVAKNTVIRVIGSYASVSDRPVEVPSHWLVYP